MVRRVGLCILAVALALSLGVHWLTLQTVAWTGMFVSFAQNDSFGTALSKTFDGQHACKLCIAVREGVGSERATDDHVPVRKLDLADLTTAVVRVELAPPAPAIFPMPTPGAIRPMRPPVPPPRQA